MCTVRLGHKDKPTRCRFFVVSEDTLALLGMPDIELLGILKIVCEAVGGQEEDRKCNSETIKMSSSASCKENTDWKIRSGNVDVIDVN